MCAWVMLGEIGANTMVRRSDFQYHHDVKEKSETGKAKASSVDEVDDMDVSNWDIDSSQWKVTSGTYDVYVGRSSKDIQLTGVLIIS